MRTRARGTTQGIFIFTRETEKLSGRGCVLTKQENTAQKPTTSCISAIKANPVAVALTGDILVAECDCTIDIPITLNRTWSTDVDLIVIAKEKTSGYNPSGETIRPAVSGVDFHAYSGNITISAGNLFENFNVELINNTGDSTKSWFQVEVVYVEYGTICREDYNGVINVVIEPV